jgi:UDP-N-acetylmuramoyl-tripeptide--D-alanyl-D-alanine ligase
VATRVTDAQRLACARGTEPPRRDGSGAPLRWPAVRFSASQIATAVGGELRGPEAWVDGASIDSRSLVAGQLFVPIVAERDGHDYLSAAVTAGAAAVLTQGDAPVGVTTVRVADTVAALTELGRFARARIEGPVVGITGSVGKTSTKDLAASVLARRFVTAASERSFNNELGVPLTLVNAPDGTGAAVLEKGSRGAGHIAHLCSVGNPTVAVVTAVELVHAELMGNLDAIAAAKGELVEALPPGGTAVLNAADLRVAAMATRTTATVVRYGTADSEVRAVDVVVDDELRVAFVLDTDWGSTPVRLGVRGVHQVSNALAAAAVGLVLGVDLAEIATGLGEAQLSPWRMDLRTAPSGARVLNDAYNAGPASTEAALRSLAALDATRRIAVLGPMAELGASGSAEHRRIAAVAESLGVELVAVGTDDYGVAPVGDVEDVVVALGPLGPTDAVLVKGSRVAGLERVAEELLAPVD